MVIENGEGKYALAIDFEIAFEIALPEFVGGCARSKRCVG